MTHSFTTRRAADLPEEGLRNPSIRQRQWEEISMTNVSSFARRGALPIGLALLALTTLPASAQDLRQITYVQPSPSAINSYPVHVAIGEGYFADEGLEVIPQSVNGSSAILRSEEHTSELQSLMRISY